jgi:hypothetical protein
MTDKVILGLQELEDEDDPSTPGVAVKSALSVTCL